MAKTLEEKIRNKGSKIKNPSPSQALFSDIDTNTEDKNQKTQEVESNIAKVKKQGTDEKQESPINKENKQELDDSKGETTDSMSDLKKNLLSYTNKKVEETHKRSTFLVRKDLLDRLNVLADGKHGYKTDFINYAIESTLNEIETELNK